MISLPAERYSVIYADPPWHFSTYSAAGRGRTADAWYDCMSFEDIKAIPISSISAKDCVLLLWVPDSHLRAAFGIIDAWGFSYKTVGFYWVKTNRTDADSYFMGLGFWTRTNPEQCLLATRGHPRRTSAAVRKLIVAPRRAHSQKPEEAYERIEALLPGPYIELFARSRREGWAAWDDETESGPGKRRYRSDMR